MMWIILLAVFGLRCFDRRRPKDDIRHYNSTTTIDASAARRRPDELDPVLQPQQQQCDVSDKT